MCARCVYAFLARTIPTAFWRPRREKYSPNCLLSDFYICISWRNLKNDCRVSLLSRNAPAREGGGNTKKHRPLFYHSPAATRRQSLRDLLRSRYVAVKHKHKHETRRDETKRDKARDERSCCCYHYRCCCCTSALIVLLDARTTEYWTGTKSAHEAAVAAAAAAALPTVAGSSISWATKLQNSRTLAALSYALSVLKRAAWSSFERAVCLLREFLSVKLAVKPEREWEQHPFSLCYWPSNRFSSLFAVAAANKGTRGAWWARGER